MPQFTSDWFSPHIPAWTKIFQAAGWRAESPNVVIEIGSYEGRSSIWILENLLHDPACRLYCVDTFPEADKPDSYFARFKANLAEASRGADDRRAQAFIGRSSDFLLHFAVERRKAQFVYVDGSHRAADVLVDLVLAFDVLCVGGLVICDDYLGGTAKDALLDNPKLAIDAFTNVFRDKIQIIPGIPLYQIAFQKIAERLLDDRTSRGEAG